MGYDWERRRRLEEQNNNKIKLDMKCIVCGQLIPFGTLSAYEFDFALENGVHCKKCMAIAREKKFRPPWRKK